MRSWGLNRGRGCRGFLLDKAGRIQADLAVLNGDDETLIELDINDALAVTRSLEGYLFSEDVSLQDVSDRFVRLAVHGPAAKAYISAVASHPVDLPEALSHRVVTIGGASCTVYRLDETGSEGLHLLVPVDAAVSVYECLLGAVGQAGRGRAVGWQAYNTARIEAGVPIYHVDFGPDSLPHETGLLDRAVSFTKGCYVGQEIVARMQSLGHPKRVLVGLKFDDDPAAACGLTRP